MVVYRIFCQQKIGSEVLVHPVECQDPFEQQPTIPDGQVPETGEGSLPVGSLPPTVPQDLGDTKLVAQPVLGKGLFSKFNHKMFNIGILLLVQK